MRNVFIIFAFFVFSCELIVDVNVPKRPAKITLNGEFTEDSTFTVYLRKSRYILDSDDYEAIWNALVIVKEDGVNIDTLLHRSFDQYTSSNGSKPKPGKSYEIIASAPGMETVNAQSSLPQPSVLKDAILEWKTNQGQQSNFNYTIDVTFEDAAETEDYYEILLFMEYSYVNENQDTISQYYPVHIFTDNPAFSHENLNGVMFDDKLINGKETTLQIKGGDMWGEQSKFLLVLRSLTKDLYRYELTSGIQENLGGDPFAQPVHVHNNINNGFGIFAGYQETSMEVQQ
jgi:hypothetical protein